MIDLTLKAQEKLINILAQQLEYKYVRIGVRGGGCSGLEYSIGLIKEYEPDWNEYLFPNEQTLRVFVDPLSEMYIDGTTVDFIEGLDHSGFKFNNPNTTTQCGCGQSFSV